MAINKNQFHCHHIPPYPSCMMELFFFPSLTISLIIFFSFLLIIFISIRKFIGAIDYRNLPPGSFGWPIIGETLEFLHGNPNKFLRDRMKRHSSEIFKTNILGEPTAVICGPLGNKFIFSNEQKLVVAWRPHSMQKLFRSYKKSTHLPPSLLPRTSTMKESTMMRSPSFLKPEALMHFLDKIDAITEQHLNTYWVYPIRRPEDKWKAKQAIRVFPLAKLFTLSLAFRFFLGLDDDDLVDEKVWKLTQDFDDMTLGLHSIPINFPGTIFYRANKAAGVIRKEIQSIVEARRQKLMTNVKGSGSSPANQDVLSHMMMASDGEGKFMSEVEIGDKIMGLLVAGYSTVATAITFIMKYVGEKPDVYAKILEEQTEITMYKEYEEALNWNDIENMKYSWNVACEVMRLIPPLQGAFREATTDINYAGFTIPKGWKIYWTMSTTNKNPEYFPKPQKFDPTRYEGSGPVPYTHIPFGGGPRMCPGKEYARLVILTFLHNVVMKFEWEVMCPHEKIINDIMPIPSQGLPIRLQSHSEKKTVE